MHVAGATDGRGVAQLPGNGLDRLTNLALRLGLRRERTGLTQRRRGRQRTGPGTKALRRERLALLAADRTQIVVHVGGIHTLAPALVVEILKQLVARQI